MPHRRPARLERVGKRASQRRFADPAITDQRHAMELRVAIECRQRLAQLVIAANYRPTAPRLHQPSNLPGYIFRRRYRESAHGSHQISIFRAQFWLPALI
jgi:hypothetical protein